MQELINCISGPRLYRLYRTAERGSRGYTANALESLSDNILKLFSMTFKVAVYTAPFLAFYAYRKGYLQSPAFGREELQSLGRLLVIFASGYACAWLFRGLGRYCNPDYVAFVEAYARIMKLPKEDFRKLKPTLNAYDFDFDYWPVEFQWDASKLSDPKRPPEPLQQRGGGAGLVRRLPFSVLSWLAIHTFGKRMMYPGSVGVLQMMMDPVLRDGRTTIVEHHKGIRYKLKARDGNMIDTMFVDNRNSTAHGNTLVICCEGNAGFYEIGITGTPIAAGYSVLGWNHPGFGGSTGTPFPANEVNAIDTVVKFALERLQFKVNNVLLFAWSIGGYPATWAAMQYPEIKGLVLDATFDDVTELAIAKMPPSWKYLVADAVSTYFNLNISDQLRYYSGPVLLIRRTKDEIINTDPDEPVKTNRSNQILLNLFRVRFPRLMKDKAIESALISWLHQERKYYPHRINSSSAYALLKSHIEEKGAFYPLNIGDGIDFETKLNLAFYLASKTMVDYNSTHCTNLPTDLFHEPWDIVKDISVMHKL